MGSGTGQGMGLFGGLLPVGSTILTGVGSTAPSRQKQRRAARILGGSWGHSITPWRAPHLWRGRVAPGAAGQGGYLCSSEAGPRRQCWGLCALG